MDSIQAFSRCDWDDSLMLQLPQIDGQHKKLCELMNTLYELLSGDENLFREQIGSLVNQLVSYGLNHFSEEEALIKVYAPELYESHQQQHVNFAAQMRMHAARIDHISQSEGRKIFIYLGGWFMNHIRLSDSLWAKCVPLGAADADMV
jgi:hemerythrin